MGEIVYACIAPHPPVIVPEVGRGRELEVPRTLEALGAVARRLAEAAPETVLLISPHGPGEFLRFAILDSERAAGSLARFGAPEAAMEFPVDRPLADEIARRATARGIPVLRSASWGAALDWGCTVPLYHLRPQASLVAVSAAGPGPLAHREFGRAARQAVEALDRRVAVIGSADLSHALHQRPGAAAWDASYRQAVASWDEAWIMGQDLETMEAAAEDAVRQTGFLMGLLEGHRVLPHVLSYEGPFGVGYMVASLELRPSDRDHSPPPTQGSECPQPKPGGPHAGHPRSGG